jgi:DNA-binding SARP family transcriptional activator
LRRHPDDWTGPVKHGEKPLGENIHYEQLWPLALALPPEAPDRVRKIYEEARAIKRHSPSSFVVQIRRALEAVANDKSAEGKTLMTKTEWLINQGYLPEVFGEMSHISRIIGNLGAHDAENDVTEDDVEVVDEFFRAIIEYLYVASAKVAHVKQLIGKK